MHHDYGVLVGTLKTIVGQQRLTYAAIAKRLGTSEQTIKRLFRREREDIDRVIGIANLCGLSLFELADLAHQQEDVVFRLSAEAEELLSIDLGCWALFYELQRGTSLAELQAEFGISKSQSNKWLRMLEEAKLLERHPNNVVKLCFSGEQSLRIGGALQDRLFREGAADFLSEMVSFLFDRAEGPQPNIALSDKWVSQETLTYYRSEMQGLFMRFCRQSAYDRRTKARKDLVSARWMAALGPSRSISGAILAREAKVKS